MNWIMTGAIAMACGVGLGAFGAHGLRDKLDPYSISVYERAVLYHFFHALGLLIVPALERTGLLRAGSANLVCWLLLAGIVLFSGSLYVLAISGNRSLGAITPLGGAAFIAAWITLVCGSIRRT